MAQQTQVGVTTPPDRPSLGPRARALLVEARPKQWVKNLLLLAAPTAAGVLTEPGVLVDLAVAIAVFCAAASGTYYLNDLLDAAADRRHPVKRHRPIAAGVIGRGTAVGVAAGLMLAAVAVSVAFTPWPFAFTLVGYVALTVAYSVRLKHVAVVDIVVVAAGFVIRAIAGGLAVGVPVSNWFLLVATFGALFVVVGKRHTEVARLGTAGSGHRVTLAAYPPAFTQHLLTLASGVSVVAYCLWATETESTGSIAAPWPALSVLPFAMLLFRYAMLVFCGRGGEPEELVLSDRHLQAFGAVWLAVLLVGIYVA